MSQAGNRRQIDWSARGRARVYLVTVFGTLACIAIALIFDSYDFESGKFALSDKWYNNVIIPLLLAPPLFYYLLAKMRELAVAHGELMNLASTDSLTSCLNRRAFTVLVEGYLERIASQQDNAEGALLVIDIDHFKRVNDTFGHDRDEALRLIAGAIRNSVRDIDLVGRLGGEEFGVFLPGLSAERTTNIAERIRSAIHDAAFAPDGRQHRLSASIGGAFFDGETSYSSLYQAADQRLYAAKRSGRDRIDIQPPSPIHERQVMLH